MTRQIQVGSVAVGGGAPVSIQSMTTTPTQDVTATVAQIRALTTAGCDIVRVAVPDMDAARAVAEIKRQITLPLVVDIHFDYRLALTAVEGGADKVRINPGNIGGRDKVRMVAQACQERGVPIRIGVNGGSLEKPLLERYGGVTPDALVESALGHIRLLEEVGFSDICVSLKSSSVPITMAAYEKMSQVSDYPLHLGVTEAGTLEMGNWRSAGPRNRRYLPGDADRRPGGGDSGGQGHSAGSGPAQGWSGADRLSHLRPDKDRPDSHGPEGGGAAPADRQAYYGGGDGLRGQRPGGSPARRCGNRGRKRRGRAVQAWPDRLPRARGGIGARPDGTD